MPRRPRIKLAGMPQDIVQRGNRFTQKVRGRRAGKPDQAGDTETQNDFGF